MNLQLEKSASIQPRQDLPKFGLAVYRYTAVGIHVPVYRYTGISVKTPPLPVIIQQEGAHSVADGVEPGWFEGGETTMLKPWVLDYWKGYDGSRGR